MDVDQLDHPVHVRGGCRDHQLHFDGAGDGKAARERDAGIAEDVGPFFEGPLVHRTGDGGAAAAVVAAKRRDRIGGVVVETVAGGGRLVVGK